MTYSVLILAVTANKVFVVVKFIGVNLRVEIIFGQRHVYFWLSDLSPYALPRGLSSLLYL